MSKNVLKNMLKKKHRQRYWEVDSLRGIAIVLMIIYHSLFDLDFFGKVKIDMGAWYLNLLQKFIASTFIFLVGLSLTISYAKEKKKNKVIGKLNYKDAFLKYLKRGGIVFGYGLIITLVTWLFLREGFVVFGILHFIGLSIMLSYFFMRYVKNYFYLLLAVVFIVLGPILQGITLNTPWLVWLGIMPNYFYSVDYFPLFPWFGVVLLGLFFGNILYPEGQRKFKIKDLSSKTPIRALSFMGRHSLLIYLLHQPLIVAVIYLL
ncbi:MAG: DUF1624 domain-containing protein [Candidatus Woesearchaeota archaeon]|nr:DUF1624 domain-containing protein [Candidatus Woesearchaeota archaeon]